MLRIETDSLKLLQIKDDMSKLERTSDSLKILISSKRVKVLLIDTLYAYSYVPKKYSNLKNEADWVIEYNSLKEDFVENKWVRLDTIIGMEYVNLIKKQIDTKKPNRLLDLEELNTNLYEFKSISYACDDPIFCLNGYKLYRPVFNLEKNKGCYLFSFKCSSGICREFIFIEMKNGKWNYVGTYPTHLLDGEN